ncbi:MAG: methyltransferase [Rhodobacterales bacterium 32-66-9]|nr:MAG: methyltransferase [Rhodobacterales bacterium 32-66-9]
MFAEAELTDDRFLCGQLTLLQPVRGYRAATDPVLLAAACPAKPGQSVLDLGCGAGAAALCLGRRVPGLTLAGLELQPAYADLARRNALRNHIPLEVIANPPYYAPGGSPSPIEARARAMQIETPLTAWVQAATRRLRPGGWLTLICGTDGMPEVLAALAPRLGSASVLPLAPREGRPALRIILQARKGGRAAFRLLAPLVIHQGPVHDGDRESYAPAANAVLRHGADLLALFR